METKEGKFGGLFFKYLKNKRSNRTLLFLHGFTGNSSIWKDYVENLGNDFNIVLIDLFGHGQSDSPNRIEEFLFQNQANIIINILNILKIEKVVIITCSYSCHIGLDICEKINQKTESIIFISPYLNKKKYNFFQKLGLVIVRHLWKLMIPDKKNKLDYAKLENYENPSFRDTKYTLRCINTKDILGSIYAFSGIDGILLSDLKIPVLIIYGNDDKMFSRKLISHFKDFKMAKLIAFKNKKHLFIKTESGKVVEMIKKFLLK